MGIEVKIIADSIGRHNRRITTFQLKYHRFFHAEVMTHRVFSRNASSSRAIPVAKMIEQVENDPATPIHWGKNIAGMQAKEEFIGVDRDIAEAYWICAAKNAAATANKMNEMGIHKQVVNRILEPFQWIHVVMTTTELDNFFALRNHSDAQPEIQLLAQMMQVEYNKSTPKALGVGEWHLPYLLTEEADLPIDVKKKISTARCCRVSYLKHDGMKPSVDDDLLLADRLAGSVPIHASPFEHASECQDEDKFFFNHRGWKSYRWYYERDVVPTLEKR